AILPIGAYEPRWFMRDQHMNPSDAVKALADCGATQALAHHHGTFQLTDEAIDAPEIALGVALDEAKVPRDKFAALKPGQVVEIYPRPALAGRGRREAPGEGSHRDHGLSSSRRQPLTPGPLPARAGRGRTTIAPP